MQYKNDEFAGTHYEWSKRLNASLPRDNPENWPMPEGEKPPVKVQPEPFVRVPTTEQLLYSLEASRKAAEDQGVAVNGIRYSGSQSNRQALFEALEMARMLGAESFATWKDSDGLFHAVHPVADVQQALMSIAERRGLLIAQEGVYAQRIQSGAITSYAEIEALVWGA